MLAVNTRCSDERALRSEFCMSHTCRVCLREGLPLDKFVQDYVPHNVCADQPLSIFVSDGGRSCENQVGNVGSSLCRTHEKARKPAVDGGLKLQCEGQTKKGRRCKDIGMCEKPPYSCAAHFDQRPQSDDEASSEDELSSEDDTEKAESEGDVIMEDTDFETVGKPSLSGEFWRDGLSSLIAGTVDGSEGSVMVVENEPGPSPIPISSETDRIYADHACATRRAMPTVHAKDVWTRRLHP